MTFQNYFMSETSELDAPWEKATEMLQEIHIDLSDSDLSYAEGKENDLLERVAGKMNRTPQEARMWIESVSSNGGKAGKLSFSVHTVTIILVLEYLTSILINP